MIRRIKRTRKVGKISKGEEAETKYDAHCRTTRSLFQQVTWAMLTSAWGTERSVESFGLRLEGLNRVIQVENVKAVSGEISTL